MPPGIIYNISRIRVFNNLFGFGKNSHAYEEIVPRQLEQKRLSAEHAQIFDVGEPYEYKEGYIPGTQLFLLGQLTRCLKKLGLKTGLIRYLPEKENEKG